MQDIHSYFFSSTNFAIILLICLFVYAGCSSVITSTKDIQDKNALQTTFVEAFDPLLTSIGSVYKDKLNRNPDLTGAILVSDGEDALFHRAYLTRMAQKSILLQTYIYKNDISSRLLMHEMWLAAQRGVKIKMLVDDNGLDSDYSDIIALDSHPNIEVRIFNPYKNRSKILRYPEMVYNFNRINHRMHNKMFIADDIALIIGGRNIADNYFDQNHSVNFVDTDVLFLGEIAQRGKESFYEYWEFHRSIPVSFLPFKPSLTKLEEAATKLKENPQWQNYNEIIEHLIQKYQHKEAQIFWGNAHLIADKPEKVEDPQTPKPISQALNRIFNFTYDNVYISAAYFVPGKEGMKYFKNLASSGVEISILTNSLASTDSLVVYAGWERYRNILIQEGVKVYEYQHLGQNKAKLRDKMAKSKASLHSKSIVFDDSITWIGSFNLDQRSANLNTEVVVVFDNPHFAKILKQDLIEDMENAWKVYDDHGKTLWEGEQNGEIVILKHPPDTGIGTRFLKTLSKILPEDQI